MPTHFRMENLLRDDLMVCERERESEKDGQQSLSPP